MFKTYFTFTKNQGRAIISLLVCIFICMLIYFLIPSLLHQKSSLSPNELHLLMAKIQLEEKENDFSEQNLKRYSPQNLTPFPFDPNTLDSLGFLKMGLREKLVHTILNYRNKGGRFYNKEGMKRIYGLHPDEFKQLEPYIRISNLYSNADFKQTGNQEFLSIDINKADTATFKKLRGIGSKLAINMVQYRNQLGGFVNKEQLKEVYGISAETYTLISAHVKVVSSSVKQINLNEATFQEINAHPYLRGSLAKAIVDLRKQKNYHFENLEQLKEIELLDEKLFRKIAPYIHTP